MSRPTGCDSGKTGWRSPNCLVGSSIVMGYGVRDDEPFPRLVEDRLNAQKKHDDTRIELLNFGTGKSFAIHRRALLDQKVFKFHPDVIYIIGHQDEYLGLIPHLRQADWERGRSAVSRFGTNSQEGWGYCEHSRGEARRDCSLMHRRSRWRSTATWWPNANGEGYLRSGSTSRCRVSQSQED